MAGRCARRKRVAMMRGVRRRRELDCEHLPPRARVTAYFDWLRDLGRLVELGSIAIRRRAASGIERVGWGISGEDAVVGTPVALQMQMREAAGPGRRRTS